MAELLDARRFFLQFVEDSMAGQVSSMEQLQVVHMLRDPSMRRLVANTILDGLASRDLSPEAVPQLRVVIHAALREANNSQDLVSCIMFFHVAACAVLRAKSGAASTPLWDYVREHEVSRSAAFWRFAIHRVLTQGVPVAATYAAGEGHARLEVDEILALFAHSMLRAGLDRAAISEVIQDAAGPGAGVDGAGADSTRLLSIAPRASLRSLFEWKGALALRGATQFASPAAASTHRRRKPRSEAAPAPTAVNPAAGDASTAPDREAAAPTRSTRSDLALPSEHGPSSPGAESLRRTTSERSIMSEARATALAMTQGSAYSGGDSAGARAAERSASECGSDDSSDPEQGPRHAGEGGYGAGHAGGDYPAARGGDAVPKRAAKVLLSRLKAVRKGRRHVYGIFRRAGEAGEADSGGDLNHEGANPVFGMDAAPSFAPEQGWKSVRAGKAAGVARRASTLATAPGARRHLGNLPRRNSQSDRLSPTVIARALGHSSRLRRDSSASCDPGLQEWGVVEEDAATVAATSEDEDEEDEDEDGEPGSTRGSGDVEEVPAEAAAALRSARLGADDARAPSDLGLAGSTLQFGRRSPDLLPRERVVWRLVGNLQLPGFGPPRNAAGVVVLTTYRLLFVPLEEGYEQPIFKDFFSFPLLAISNIERGGKPRALFVRWRGTPSTQVERGGGSSSPGDSRSHMDGHASLSGPSVDSSVTLDDGAEAGAGAGQGAPGSAADAGDIGGDATGASMGLDEVTGAADADAASPGARQRVSDASSTGEVQSAAAQVADSGPGSVPFLISGNDFRLWVFTAAVSEEAEGRVAPFHSLCLRLAFADLRRSECEAYCFTDGVEPAAPEVAIPPSPSAVLEDGWRAFDMGQELQRQGALDSGKWRVTGVNEEYALCATYPASLGVPAVVSDGLLREVAGFRSKRRLPALTYYHAPTGAAIVRCAQPLVGMIRSRSKADEIFLGVSECRTIYDARPRKNAVANMLMGKGYELVSNYEQTGLHFLDIENIHVQREALARLADACSPSTAMRRGVGVGGNAGAAAAPVPDQWLGAVEASGWLRHVSLVLRGAVRIVQTVQGGGSVCVHCSDGWDRTAQLCALAQMMLDPWSRTLRGFVTCVEKDWCAFGHMFGKRLGHGRRRRRGGSGADQRSPIFLQFLDAVWQLQQQFPAAFEYSPRFLVHVLDAAHSGRWGTFLFDCERERAEQRLPDRTASLWTRVLSAPDQFRNPLYRARDDVLAPCAHVRAMRLWRDVHCRWDPMLREHEDVHERTAAMWYRLRELETQLTSMRRDTVSKDAAAAAAAAATAAAKRRNAVNGESPAAGTGGAGTAAGAATVAAPTTGAGAGTEDAPSTPTERAPRRGRFVQGGLRALARRGDS